MGDFNDKIAQPKIGVPNSQAVARSIGEMISQCNKNTYAATLEMPPGSLRGYAQPESIPESR
jgi:hypothetical protein